MIYPALRNQTIIMLIYVNIRSFLAEAAPAVTDELRLQKPVEDGSRPGHTSTLTARCSR